MEYTDADFIEAWNSSESVAEARRKLGLPPSFGYKRMYEAADRLGLDRSHMTHRAANPKGRRPIEELLKENTPETSSSTLRRRLIQEGVLKEECSNCKMSEWLGEPMPLELDHINGDHGDNRLENLRILCRNCHGLTATWGKHKDGKKVMPRTQHLWMVTRCPECGKHMTPGSNLCEECRLKARKKTHLTGLDGVVYSAQEVYDMVYAEPYLTVSYRIGVESNTIRKFLRYNGLVPPKKTPKGKTKTD